MTPKLLFKLVALLTALTATVVAMMWLKQGHMSDFWASLGVDRSGQRLNWCKERVQSLYFYDNQSKLLEKDGKWMWSKRGDLRELDYLRVEKWFAKYCMARVEEVKDQPADMPIPLFEVQFINGDRLTVHQFGEGVFEVQNQIYRSDSLQEGIKELLAFDKRNE